MKNPRGTAFPARLIGPWLDQLRAVAGEVHRRGWAEANAGNFSVRTGRPGRWALELVVKSAGARMRDIARDPCPHLCLVRTDTGGRVIGLYPSEGRPSSELRAHVAAHLVLSGSSPGLVAVLHCHPTSTIALGSRSRTGHGLIRALVAAHLEGPLYIRDRVGAVPFHAPGSAALAKASARAFRSHRAVIWPRHGIIAAGADFDSCLDIIEVVDKAASLALLAS